MPDDRSSLIVCVAGNGDLFVWGSNKHGQLAASDIFLPSPSLVKPALLRGEKVTRVWSGWTHIVAQTGASTLHTRQSRCIVSKLTESCILKTLCDVTKELTV